MELDRRKHDLDVLERVLGASRHSRRSDNRARVVDVDLPAHRESSRPTLELTVGLDEESSSRGRDRRRRP